MEGVKLIMDFKLYEEIHQLLKSYGDHKPHEKGLDYNFVHDSGLDSFELLNFIADVEEIFAVQFSPEELSQCDTHTVEGLSRLIASKHGKSG